LNRVLVDTLSNLSLFSIDLDLEKLLGGFKLRRLRLEIGFSKAASLYFYLYIAYIRSGSYSYNAFLFNICKVDIFHTSFSYSILIFCESIVALYSRYSIILIFSELKCIIYLDNLRNMSF
jgi:hypothetical protein